MSTPKPKSEDRPDQTSSEPTGPEPTLPGVAQPEEIETEEDQAEDDGDESEEDEPEDGEDDKPKAKRTRGKAKAKKPDPPEAVQLPVVPPKTSVQEIASELVEWVIERTEGEPRERRFAVARASVMYALKLLPAKYVAATKRAA